MTIKLKRYKRPTRPVYRDGDGNLKFLPRVSRRTAARLYHEYHQRNARAQGGTI